MNRDEFRKRLDRLHEVLFRGLAYYTVWKRLLLHDPGRVSWSLQEQNEVLGRYHGFITPVAFALRDMALMEFTKMFDADRRTASLVNLRNAARQDPNLVPRAGTGDLDGVSARLQQSQPILARLRRRRNQQIAHVYPQPTPVSPVRNTDLDKLVDAVKSAFNLLSTAHDGRFVSWEYPLKTADEHTIATLHVLRKEIERKQKQHQEEMVRIGLEAIQSQQAVIGRRLSTEELRSTGQSFGLTGQEMQRVEEQYSSN